MTGQDTQMQGQPISMGAHVSTTLTTSDFDYDLPEELIAQTPVEPRDASRLMVMDRHTGAVSHHVFSEIADMLSPGDVLVINDSKVIPARLRGYKAAKCCGGNAVVATETDGCLGSDCSSGAPAQGGGCCRVWRRNLARAGFGDITGWQSVGEIFLRYDKISNDL